MSGGGAGLMSGGGASMTSGTPGGRGTSGFGGCSIMPGSRATRRPLSGRCATRLASAGARPRPRPAELMLAPLFHAWERYLASISKDRTVRPFEWGLEWLSPNGGEGAVNHPANPEEHLQRWVADVMSDTRAFFHAPPTREYDFEPAPAGSQMEEAGTLRF